MPTPGPFECALCGSFVRSVYSLPGDTKARMCCSTCFFGLNQAEGAAPTAPSNAEQSPSPHKEKESCDSE